MRTALLLPLVLAGCYHAQRPVQFAAAAPAEDPVAIVTRALAAAGQTPAFVDPQAGVLQTRWENTGFYWRRYTVTLGRKPAGLDVSLREDGQFCEGVASAPDGVNLVGQCRVNNLGVIGPHQADLDSLGARLRQALPPG